MSVGAGVSFLICVGVDASLDPLLISLRASESARYVNDIEWHRNVASNKQTCIVHRHAVTDGYQLTVHWNFVCKYYPASSNRYQK